MIEGKECSSINGCVQGFESQWLGTVEFPALSNAAKKSSCRFLQWRDAYDPAHTTYIFYTPR